MVTGIWLIKWLESGLRARLHVPNPLWRTSHVEATASGKSATALRYDSYLAIVNNETSPERDSLCHILP